MVPYWPNLFHTSVFSHCQLKLYTVQKTSNRIVSCSPFHCQYNNICETAKSYYVIADLLTTIYLSLASLIKQCYRHQAYSSLKSPENISKGFSTVATNSFAKFLKTKKKKSHHSGFLSHTNQPFGPQLNLLLEPAT